MQHLQRETEVPFEQIAAALAVLAQGDLPLLLTEELRPTELVRRTSDQGALPFANRSAIV